MTGPETPMSRRSSGQTSRHLQSFNRSFNDDRSYSFDDFRHSLGSPNFQNSSFRFEDDSASVTSPFGFITPAMPLMTEEPFPHSREDFHDDSAVQKLLFDIPTDQSMPAFGLEPSPFQSAQLDTIIEDQPASDVDTGNRFSFAMSKVPSELTQPKRSLRSSVTKRRNESVNESSMLLFPSDDHETSQGTSFPGVASHSRQFNQLGQSWQPARFGEMSREFPGFTPDPEEKPGSLRKAALKRHVSDSAVFDNTRFSLGPAWNHWDSNPVKSLEPRLEDPPAFGFQERSPEHRHSDEFRNHFDEPKIDDDFGGFGDVLDETQEFRHTEQEHNYPEQFEEFPGFLRSSGSLARQSSSRLSASEPEISIYSPQRPTKKHKEESMDLVHCDQCARQFIASAMKDHMKTCKPLKAQGRRCVDFSSETGTWAPTDFHVNGFNSFNFQEKEDPEEIIGNFLHRVSSSVDPQRSLPGNSAMVPGNSLEISSHGYDSRKSAGTSFRSDSPEKPFWDDLATKSSRSPRIQEEEAFVDDIDKPFRCPHCRRSFAKLESQQKHAAGCKMAKREVFVSQKQRVVERSPVKSRVVKRTSLRSSRTLHRTPSEPKHPKQAEQPVKVKAKRSAAKAVEEKLVAEKTAVRSKREDPKTKKSAHREYDDTEFHRKTSDQAVKLQTYISQPESSKPITAHPFAVKPVFPTYREIRGSQEDRLHVLLPTKTETLVRPSIMIPNGEELLDESVIVSTPLHRKATKDTCISPVRWSVVDKYVPRYEPVKCDTSPIKAPIKAQEQIEVGFTHHHHEKPYDPSRYSATTASTGSSALRSSLGRSLELQYSRLREQIRLCSARLQDNAYRAG